MKELTCCFLFNSKTSDLCLDTKEFILLEIELQKFLYDRHGFPHNPF